MKKILLFITLISFGFSKGQIVNIPDVNFKNALLNNQNVNINNDNEIQISEANDFTDYLNMNNRGISDLTGIEEFINIWRLQASYNQLSTVNLNNNINLTQLTLYGNQLTSIDVSSNINLINFGFSDNPIVNIDLSNNNLLVTLDCSDTLLNEIDLSSLSNLEWVVISNNPNLNYINLKNGNNENMDTAESNFHSMPNLETVCIDDENSNFGVEINGTGHFVNFTENCTLSIIENKLLNFSVYPTPTENILNIKSKTEITKIEVYSKLGQKIKETKENQIDISNLTQGLYFVKVEDINGNFGVKKIVKK